MQKAILGCDIYIWTDVCGLIVWVQVSTDVIDHESGKRWTTGPSIRIRPVITTNGMTLSIMGGNKERIKQITVQLHWYIHFHPFCIPNWIFERKEQVLWFLLQSKQASEIILDVVFEPQNMLATSWERSQAHKHVVMPNSIEPSLCQAHHVSDQKQFAWAQRLIEIFVHNRCFTVRKNDPTIEEACLPHSNTLLQFLMVCINAWSYLHVMSCNIQAAPNFSRVHVLFACHLKTVAYTYIIPCF